MKQTFYVKQAPVTKGAYSISMLVSALVVFCFFLRFYFLPKLAERFPFDADKVGFGINITLVLLPILYLFFKNKKVASSPTEEEPLEVDSEAGSILYSGQRYLFKNKEIQLFGYKPGFSAITVGTVIELSKGTQKMPIYTEGEAKDSSLYAGSYRQPVYAYMEKEALVWIERLAKTTSN